MSRVACVVGASSGIGLAIARRLRREGYSVIALSRRSPPDGTADRFVPCDVRSEEDVGLASEQVLASGVPEVVVYSAGAAAMGRTLEVPEPAAREVFEVNYWGMLRVVSRFVPAMRSARKGTVVVVSSLAAVRAVPFEACYAASKAAAARWLECLAFEAQADGVMIKLLSPGFIDTGFRERARWFGMDRPNIRGSGLDPDVVAEHAFRLLRSRRSSCIPGWRERAIVAADRFAPGLYDRVLDLRMGRRR